MRKHGRTDQNHRSVVDTLRNLGCSVLSLANLGSGVPDLLVARCGKMALIEIKNGDTSPSKQRLTEDQIKFHTTWNAPVHIVRSVTDAIEVVDKYL